MRDFPIFGENTDHRRSNATRHDFHEMLIIALPGDLSGRETCTDMAEYGMIVEDFPRQLMTLSHGIPSHDAVSDLFNSFNPDAFGRVLVRLPGVGRSDWQTSARIRVLILIVAQYRCQVGRAARDAYAYTLGKDTRKMLGLSFWDYLGNRLEFAGAPDVPRPADLIRQRANK